MDMAGKLHPSHPERRQVLHHRDPRAGPDERVCRVDRGSRDTNHDLARPRFGHGMFDDLQDQRFSNLEECD
jgi:hypothetical protein